MLAAKKKKNGQCCTEPTNLKIVLKFQPRFQQPSIQHFNKTPNLQVFFQIQMMKYKVILPTSYSIALKSIQGQTTLLVPKKENQFSALERKEIDGDKNTDVEGEDGTS